MTEITFDDTPGILKWAAEKIGIPGFREDAKCFGVLREGKLCGAVVYDCFSQCDCNVHIASDGSRRWISKHVLAYGFSYPFIQCGLRRITGLVPAKNIEAIEFDKHIGFTIEGLCHDAMPDDDIVILGMTRKRCPWIPREYRK